MNRTARPRRPAPLRRSDTVMAATVLLLAGFVDAIAFVVLKGNFVAFMSGNTTIMAASATTDAPNPLAITAALLGLFFVGCVLGAGLARWSGAHAATAVFTVVITAMTIGAGTATAGSVTAGMLVIAVGTGVMNSVLARSATVHTGLSYVTGTLVTSAHRLVEGIGTAHPWAWLTTFRWWLLFALGAGAGGFAYSRLGAPILWIAPVLAVIALAFAEREPAPVPTAP